MTTTAPHPPRRSGRRRGLVVGSVATAAIVIGVVLGVALLGSRPVAGVPAAVTSADGSGSTAPIAGGSGATAPTAGEGRSNPLDLHAVDWSRAVLPGSVCRSPRDITLSGGDATSVPSSFDGPEPNYPQDVHLDVASAAYGDVTGDGRDEVALGLRCNNHDSTAAGTTVVSTLVFDGSSGRAKLLGTLVSSQPRLGEIPNGVTITRLSPGRADGTELFYGPSDANCCPSGKATTTWPYADGDFGTPTAKVTQSAAGAPPR